MNILLEGILWAGRGQVKKSLLYLLSVKKMYHSASDALDSELKLKLKKSFASELDSIYTHNLFYLAQAYGENHVDLFDCLLDYFFFFASTLHIIHNPQLMQNLDISRLITAYSKVISGTPRSPVSTAEKPYRDS